MPHGISDSVALRAIYSQYTKIQLEYNNEIVLIPPYYEAPDTVMLVLSGRNGYDNNSSINPFEYSGVDVGKYEKEGSLMIIDSLKGYFLQEDKAVIVITMMTITIIITSEGIWTLCPLYTYY